MEKLGNYLMKHILSGSESNKNENVALATFMELYYTIIKIY